MQLSFSRESVVIAVYALKMNTIKSGGWEGFGGYPYLSFL